MRSIALLLLILNFMTGNLAVADRSSGDKTADSSSSPAEEGFSPDAPAAELPSIVRLSIAEGVELSLIAVPPGRFMMGSASGEGHEAPVHEVTLTTPFYLGQYEITQKQWEAVMGFNLSRTQGGDHPVENVTWEEAVEFARTLTAQVTGWTFRLPTEAEWEYACRAGSTSEYSFGEDSSGLGEYGWYVGNSDYSTHPVGQKKPNSWGFHDMHGNVAELCADWFGPYTLEARTNPQGPRTGAMKVFRGGRWNYPAEKCRSARRSSCPVNFPHPAVGFRVAAERIPAPTSTDPD